MHCSLALVLDNNIALRKRRTTNSSKLARHTSSAWVLVIFCEQIAIKNDTCEISKRCLASSVASYLRCYKQQSLVDLTPTNTSDPDSGWVNILAYCQSLQDFWPLLYRVSKLCFLKIYSYHWWETHLTSKSFPETFLMTQEVLGPFKGVMLKHSHLHSCY